MKEEEKKIWRDHQSRLAAISREKNDFTRAYIEKREALMASYGEVPPEETLKMAKAAIKTLKDIHNREHQEIVRYMDEIEAYDRRRNPEQEKKELSEEDKQQFANTKSRFLEKMGWTPAPEQASPRKGVEKEKGVDIDKDDI